MAHHFLLGLGIRQKLACPGVNPQRANPSKAPFSGQREENGYRPVNTLADGQLRVVAAKLCAELVHDILCYTLSCGKRRDIQWLGDMDIDVQRAIGWKRHGWQMGNHEEAPARYSRGMRSN
jgi:hypothetical protein